ncbi:MAG: hypothetical protein ACFFCS_06145 [Candidatus Hodarchaeota archaeon]
MAKKKTQEKKKMTAREIRTFTSKKLDTVSVLAQSGKKVEGMVYMFYIIAWLVEDKFDIKKPISATVREFLSSLVMEKNFPPDNVYPYLSFFEEALYSHHELPEELYRTHMALWTNLYRDVTGDTPPNFTL